MILLNFFIFSEIYDEILFPTFESSILEKQGLLDDEEGQNLILQFIPDIDILFFSVFLKFSHFPLFFVFSLILNFLHTRNALGNAWKNDDTTTSFHKWSQFKETIRKEIQTDLEKYRKVRGYKKKFYSDPVLDVVFAFTYPRFDKNVSIGLNHLLKAPFCIHPGTGKLCVPIDPNKSANFDPDKVPYLDSMVEEVAKSQTPSIHPYIEFFTKKFLAPIQREINATTQAVDPTSF